MTELPNFEIRNEPLWAEYLAKNQEGYGYGCVRFAARWANFMERELAAGKNLVDIAGSTSHEADDNGITGFMYGCGVSMLAQCWAHGDELRRWSNLEIQIGTEGEKANADGGVLNPALLSIG